jgi:hypothetical protein
MQKDVPEGFTTGELEAVEAVLESSFAAPNSRSAVG